MTSQRRQVQRRTPQQAAGAVAVAEDDTAPAVDTTEAEQDSADRPDDTTPPAVGPVKMRISPDMLRQLLRLRPEVAVTSARWDTESGLIEFGIDSPSAPLDAVELLVTYRHTGGQDPIHAVSTWSTTPATP